MLEILPNSIPPVIVQATLFIGVAVIVEASLSFIGLGVQPPTPSWGTMLADARNYIFSGEWWIALFPGLAICLTVVGINLIGDAMRDMLDPRAGVRSGFHLTMQGSSQPLLRFEGVTIATRGSDSSRVLVSDVDLHVSAGEALGIVGEFGSGKSLTALSVAGLLPSGVALSSGRISFEGKVLTELPDLALHRLRGKQISYVFQDPLTALNPTITIGRQITDVLSQHVGGSRKTLKRGAIEILSRLGIADAEKRVRSYPHQLSGGMRQRVLIALAMVCKPRILIADEPTTALDVTVQAKILELFRAIRTTGISLIFISHNIDVVLEFCDRVVVMYGGRVMEVGTAEEIGMAARHPYTQALLECVPRLGTNLERLRVIDGQPQGPRRPSRVVHFRTAVRGPWEDAILKCLFLNRLPLHLHSRAGTLHRPLLQRAQANAGCAVV